MPTGLQDLLNQINTRLTCGGLTALQCCQLQNAKCILENNIVYSVRTPNDLPTASLNKGRIAYIECIPEYRYSDGGVWLSDFSSDRELYGSQLWSWGLNSAGSLGDGTTELRISPVKEFCGDVIWCQASSSLMFSVAAGVKTDGTLWSWGCNRWGVVGDATQTDSCSPVQELCSATNWCQVSVANAHISALKQDSTIWSWGNGIAKGTGDTSLSTSPVQEFCSDSTWGQVSTREVHTTAIKTDGTLWAWGCQRCGRLGDGTASFLGICSPVQEFCSDTTWCQVSAGRDHTSAIKTNGTLWSWGNNSRGHLADGTTTNRCSPIQEICSDTTWCQTSSGNISGSAIKTDGTLWSWGCNRCGRLGDGTNTISCSPVQEVSSSTNWCQVSMGCYHASAVKTDGTLWGWGSGSRIGDGTNVSRCSPVQEATKNTNWTQVSVGGGSTVAIKEVFKGFKSS